MAKYAPKGQIGGFMTNLDQMNNFMGSLAPSLSYSHTDHAGVKAAYFQAA